MNPIIETIEVGHVNHGDRCKVCKVKWPCAPILQARKHNETYVPVPDSPEALTAHNRKP